MHDPYKLTGPTCLSFSGGRTSAYMLRKVLDHNSADDVARWLVVCFANTGKESIPTYYFVAECGDRWGVPIVWLEYTGDDAAMYRVTDFEHAARDGQPFEALIRRRKFLPNPVSRFCTSELKIRTMHRYLRGTLGWTEWYQMIGIRADEQRRVAKIRARGTSTETPDETMLMPLADAGVSVQDVNAFWKAQPFNLELMTHNGRTLEGNCDLCFLKPPTQRLSIMKIRPRAAAWWIKMESLALADKPAGARFCKGNEPSYAELADFAANQGDMIGHEDAEPVACFCGD